MGGREADAIWDVLEEHFGAVRTKSERGRRNHVVRELRLAQATPEEVRTAIIFCERNFTHYTEGALCNWLSRALHEAGTESNVRQLFRSIQGEA